ncbi:Ig-like domain-containing protein, partial [Vibrio mediterranei]|uniref:Ig-like domain-containing protein n=1 Tax=Vibrio mediterranei TaxID=689 RepID=UPI001EFE72B0
DEAGNESRIEKNVSIDTINDFKVSLLDSSDSGVKSDWITNDDKPTFKIDFEPGSQIKLIIDDREQEIDIKGESPALFTISSNLSEGPHKVEFISEDLAGNRVTNTHELIIDKTAPDFSFAGAQVGTSSDTIITQGFTSNNLPSFLGKGEPGAIVHLVVEGKEPIETVINDSGTWSYEPKDTFLDSHYVVTAFAVDKAGNSSTHSTIQFTVDTVGPSITGRLDSSSDSGISSNDSITFDTLLKFTGRTEGNIKVRLVIKELNFDQEVYSKSDGTYEFNVNAETEGNYNYSIVAEDNAGNLSASPAKGLVVVDKHISAFSVDLTSDSGNSHDNITRVSAPSFGGIGESGAKITISVLQNNNEAIPTYGPVSVNSEGTWEATLPEQLADGVYDLRFMIQDAAGNTQEVDTSITIDTKSELTASLDVASDSGFSSHDLVTKIDRPIFSGVADKDSQVSLSLFQGNDANVIAISTTANDDGTWSIKVPAESALTKQGTWNWSAVSVDVAGNTSNTVNGEFRFDNIAPTSTIELLSKTGSDEVHTNVLNPSFVISSEPDAKVTLFVYNASGKVVSSNLVDKHDFTIGRDGKANYTLPSLSEGDFAYRLETVDAAGNNSLSDYQYLTIDNTPPEVGTISLVDASNSGDKNDTITNETQLSIKGNGAEIGSYITWSVIDKDTGEEISLPYKSWKVESENWVNAIPHTFDSDGNYEISIFAKDSAGNTSSVQSLEVTIDTHEPTLGGIGLKAGSDTGFDNSDFITKELSPTFIGSSEKGAEISLSLYKGDVLLDTQSTLVTDDSGMWELNFPQLKDGTFTWTIVATDAAGNTKELNASTQTITIDSSYEGESASLADASNSGSRDDNVTKLKDIELSGKGEIGSRVELISLTDPSGRALSVAQITPVEVSKSGDWHMSLPPLSLEGSYKWTVQFTDVAGNTEKLSDTVQLDTSISEFTALLATDTGSLNNDGVINIDKPTFRGRGEVGSEVTIEITEQTSGHVITQTASVSNDGTWDLTLKNPLTEQGIYSWTAKIVDIAGNEKTTPPTNLTLDTVAPILLSAKMDTHGAYDADPIEISTGQPQFSGISSESGSRVHVEIFTVTSGIISGNPFHVSTPKTANPDGSFTLNLDMDLPEGEYRWKIFSSDVAGNSSSSGFSAFIVDHTPPQEPDLLTLNTDTGDSASDNLTKATTPTLGGHSNEAAHLTVEILDATGQSVLQTVTQSVTANETWSVDVPTALSDGHYTWRVQATDAAGNSS